MNQIVNTVSNLLNLLVFLVVTLTITGCKSGFSKTVYNFQAQKDDPISKDIKVALVLGGGGSRAISQIGVIEVLEENNIPIDLIVGTSGGSIVGAIYADNPNSKHLKKIGLSFKKENLASISLSDAIEGARSLRGGFDGAVGEQFLLQNLTSKYFKELKIPLIAVATDIVSGETIPLRSGRITPAIRASSAIPGLFSPVEMYNMVLVDGGVTAPLAVEVAKKYNPKLIIAVDVNTPITKENVSNMFQLINRAANLSYDALSKLNGQQADILIKPDLRGAGLFDDHMNEELYIAGRKEAEKFIPKIKKLLNLNP